MVKEEMISCSMCGKEVPEWTVSRDGECAYCRAEDKANEMGVGDINAKRV